MSIWMIITTAIALSMDAFAVSITCGIANNTKKIHDKVKLALIFGIFQGLMPIIGFQLYGLIKSDLGKYSGYLAFAILFLIGAHMIREAFKIKDSCDINVLTLKKIILLAIATSIDAFAVGISFALIDINIWASAAIIAFVTVVMSYIGVVFGCKIRAKFRKSAELVGAITIMLIGIKILIESL